MLAEQAALFGDAEIHSEIRVPPTEGVKYAGSKKKLLPQILKLVRKVPAKTVLDGFSGTTRVAQALAQCGYQVTASDISAWSEVFGNCYLQSRQERCAYQGLIDHLNGLPGIAGWYTEHYGGDDRDGSAVQADGLKKPWQRRNTMRLDAMRDEIDRLDLSAVEKSVALTSLIRAMDAVDSTLGHHVSYLKDWSQRSYGDIELEVPAVNVYDQTHRVLRGDVFDVLEDISVDLAYFDPPYGSSNEKMPPSRVRYASYYHLWTTICCHDKPEIFGAAKRRLDTSDKVAGSVFEEFRRSDSGRFIAVEAIEKLLKVVNAKWVILSYSSGGRATADELNQVIQESGDIVEVIELDYKKNVMADMRWTNEWTKQAEVPNREFLFLIEK